MRQSRASPVRLSSESRRARLLVLAGAWLAVGMLALADTLAMRDYVRLLDDSGTLPTSALAFTRAAPADYADAHTWTRLAADAERGGGWQVRSTHQDDAPTGRDVHWSSVLVHLVALAGRIRAAATGEPLPRATERAIAWFNLPLFLGVVALFSWWAARRAGAAGGALIALGMIGHRWFYDGFAPGYVDHHGLLAAATFGVVLGAVFMGAGWWSANDGSHSLLPASRADARAGAIASGVAGGFGMWISAASTIPTIAIAGCAGLAAALWLGARAREAGATFDASLWRIWGWTGGLVALAAYCIEYAPHHLSMRLEVNHPLYAAAWIGGGELVGLLGERRVTGARASPWRAAIAVLALAAPLIVIAIWRQRVMVLLDPRMLSVHTHIEEFQSLPALLRASGASALARFGPGFALLLPALLVAWRGRKDRVVIAFASAVAIGGAALACWQVRWWLTASGAELALLLVGVAAVAAQWTPSARWLLVTALGAFFVEQSVARTSVTRANVEARAVTPADALQPLYRDLASAIRASQPAGGVVLLASPDASVAIGYFGGFETLGTFYWENMAGLEAAASIFSARTDDEARALLRAHGVTHIAMVSANNFLAEYRELVRRAPELTRTFGYRLLVGDSLPRWLRPIPFRPRAGQLVRSLAVLPLQVVPDQTEFEARWNIATAQAARGDAAGATRSFAGAIALVSPARRAHLFESAAKTSYQWHEHALAVRLLDSAAALERDLEPRVSKAWILATSADDGVRNGTEALSIAEPLAQQNPEDGSVMDVFAAALAETGRFADAVTVARRMLEIAQAQQDSAAVQRADDRLDMYLRGRPWRE